MMHLSIMLHVHWTPLVLGTYWTPLVLGTYWTPLVLGTYWTSLVLFVLHFVWGRRQHHSPPTYEKFIEPGLPPLGMNSLLRCACCPAAMSSFCKLLKT